MRLLIAIAILLPVASYAEDVSFSRQLAPLLVQRCLGCHNNRKTEGRYALHTFDMLLKAGDSEDSPIVAGDADESYLFQKLVETDEDLRMPMDDDAFTPEEIDLFKQWIDQGANFDGPSQADSLNSLLPTRQHPLPPDSYRTPVPVFAVKFSTDGKFLFTGGWHELLVWEIDSGTLKKRIAGLPQRIHCIEYSPDGERLAVGGGAPGEYGEIRLVDVESMAVAKSNREHALLADWGDIVIDVCFTPDGNSLIAGGADNSIRCYDLETRQLTWSNTQHVDWVTAVDVTDYRFAEQLVSNENLPDFVTLNEHEQKADTHIQQRWQFDDTRFIVRKANWELEVSNGEPQVISRITISGIGKTYKVQRESFTGDALADHSEAIRYLHDLQSKWREKGSEFVITSSKDRSVKVFVRSSGTLFTTYKGHRREYGPLKGLHRVFGVQTEPGTRRVWSVGEGKHLHGWNPVTVRDEDGTAADMEARFAKEYSTDLLRHDFPEPVFALLRHKSRLFAASASSEVKDFVVGDNAVFSAERIATGQTYRGNTDQLYTLDVANGLLTAAGFTGEVTVWDVANNDVRIRFVAAP